MAQLRTGLDENCVDFTYPNSDGFRESVAVCDEKILEKYYETDSVEKTDITGAIKERKIFPCMFGSALKLDGVKAFLNLLDEYTVMIYGNLFLFLIVTEYPGVSRISEEPCGRIVCP